MDTYVPQNWHVNFPNLVHILSLSDSHDILTGSLKDTFFDYMRIGTYDCDDPYQVSKLKLAPHAV